MHRGDVLQREREEKQKLRCAPSSFHSSCAETKAAASCCCQEKLRASDEEQQCDRYDVPPRREKKKKNFSVFCRCLTTAECIAPITTLSDHLPPPARLSRRNDRQKTTTQPLAFTSLLRIYSSSLSLAV